MTLRRKGKKLNLVDLNSGSEFGSTSSEVSGLEGSYKGPIGNKKMLKRA